MNRLLVIVAGLAGSGKSEVGRRLARGLSAAFLDKDTLSRGFVEALLDRHELDPHDRESPIYLNAVRPLEYLQMERAAFENLECGRSTVLAAPYIRELSDPQWHEDMLDRADAHEAALEVVWVRCDPPAMQRYLADRNAPRDRWKRLHWDEYMAQIRWDQSPAFPHHLIDNSSATVERAPVAQIDELLRILQP